MDYWRQPRIGILEIAIGVAIGVLAANIIETVAIASYARFQLQWAMQEMKDQQKQERERQAKAAQVALQIGQQRDAQAQAQLELQRRSQQSAKAAEMKKETAWKQFYQQPTECESMTNNDAFVKCSNDYIRAKRKFEQTYLP